MRSFSISQAAGAGFRVIRERPLSVFMWGLLPTLAGLIVMGLYVAVMGPMFLELFASFGGGSAPDEARIQTLLNQNQVGSSLLSLLGLLTLPLTIAVFGAVQRAVLLPGTARSWFGMRLTSREGWSFLSYFVVFLMVYFAFLAAVLVTIGLSFVLAGALPTPIDVLACVVLVVAVLAVFAWVALRLSLAPAMAFAENKFILAETWSLTQGNGGRLFGLGLLLILIILALELVMLAVLALMGGAAYAALGMDIDQLRALVSGPVGGWAPWVGVLALVALPVLAWFSGVLNTVALAPFADVYRQLSGSAVAEEF
ncbi:MAG TPA: hypothetical protein VGB49_08575 [Caulobacteraceae bacterium]